MSALETVYGQPSWRVANDEVEAFVTRTGGQLAPVRFRLGDRVVEPYHIPPWAEEPDPTLPPMLQALRGDFFCLPFGGNAEPFEGETHPPHGETTNEEWRLGGVEKEGDAVTLRLSLETAIRPGRVAKEIKLIDGHTAIYQRHTISGMHGSMSFGHHAMLRFPDLAGAGLVATGPFVWGQVSPLPVEDPTQRGYSLLQPGARFDALAAVPTITGQTADLSRYPARRGFEDLVMLVSEPEHSFAWSAVTFPEERFVWFTLKDPRVLRQTILWISNGGRHYPPWDGRHVNVLGFEEVTSYFHFGLAESARPNPVSEAGHPTAVDLDGSPFEVACINAVAEVPEGFDHVAAIEAHPDEETATIRSRSGKSVAVPLRHTFLTW